MGGRTLMVGRERGFSLIEAMIATVIIALTIMSVGYGVGVAGKSVREEKRVFHRSLLLTSKMTALDSTPFQELVSGADTLTVDGGTYVRGWRVARHDGNGDSSADAGLLLVTVWVDTDTCQTLRCDAK